MLNIPLKKTYEVNLVDPLKSFISAQYKTSEPDNPFADVTEEIDESITDFNKLRNKAVVQPLDKHESSLELLYRYYDQLSAVENKLPLTPTQIPINFKWKDAFDKGSLFFGKASLSLSYGSYERACVMFNIAALQSQIASSQAFTDDQQLKTAAKLFQQSAGMLTALKDAVMSLVQHEPTPDLVPDTLHALSCLMIAQAQDAIYLKASQDKMKSGLLVKVAAQAAENYQEAVKQMNRDVVKPLWEKDWISVVTGKQLAFVALANYHRGKECGENKEIGEELARLQEAVQCMGKAKAYFGSLAFNTEATLIQKAFDTAKKDNDFIYHERIPEFKSLAALPKAQLAKAIAPTNPMSQRFKDLFASLVPVAVTQALAAYEVRRTELINLQVGRMREHTQLMNSMLTSLNLPAAIDDVCNQEALPESMREKSGRVKAAGGLTQIERLIGELPSLNARNRELLEETSRLLNEEKQTDNQLRSQFKAKWTRVASDKLTEPLYQELGKFQAILGTATNADTIVRNKLEANKQGIQLLSKPEPELVAAIPSLAGGGADKNSSVIGQLKELLIEVEQMTGERTLLEQQLKQKTHNLTDEFLSAMSETGQIDEEALSKQKLNELYTPVREQISASITRQEQVMAKIQEANTRFSQERSGGAGGDAREKMLRTLATASDAHTELKANLDEATKFYNDLTPLLVRLQQKVTDFVFARKTEKDDLMQDIQKNIVGGGAPSGGGRAQPPARPPPPQIQPTPPQNYYAQPPNAMPPQASPYPQQAYGQYPGPAQGTAPPNVLPYPSVANYGTYPGAQPYANPYAGQPGQGYFPPPPTHPNPNP